MGLFMSRSKCFHCYNSDHEFGWCFANEQIRGKRIIKRNSDGDVIECNLFSEIVLPKFNKMAKKEDAPETEVRGN